MLWSPTNHLDHLQQLRNPVNAKSQKHSLVLPRKPGLVHGNPNSNNCHNLPVIHRYSVALKCP